MARTSAARQVQASRSTPASASGTSSSVGFSGKGDKLDDYGDRSSSYWPDGWDFQRYRNCKQEDLLALPGGQLEKLQLGFRDVLGDAGVFKIGGLLFEEWSQRQASSAAGTEPQVATDTPTGPEPGPAAAVATTEQITAAPNWLMMHERRFKRNDWGFVGLRTCCYGDDEQWEEFKAKLDGIARLSFEQDAKVPGVKEANERFKVQWIEDSGLKNASVETLREKFANVVPSLSACQCQTVFLLATPTTVRHLLETETPTPSSQQWRPDPPYILAAAASSDPGLEEGHEEREGFREVFKVAAEQLVSEFWFALEGMEWPVRRITPYVKGVRLEEGEVVGEVGEGEDVWWSTAPSPERMKKRRRIG